MSKQRQQQLAKKCGKQLQRSIGRMLPDFESTIDIIMFWPPDEHDGGISFLMQVDRQEVPWDFEVTKKDWVLQEEKNRQSLPRDLLADIRQLLRAMWKTVVNSQNPSLNHAGYLRLHDDICSVNLRNGRKIADDNRSDIQAASQVDQYKKKSQSYRRKKSPPTKIRLGWSVAKVQSHFETNQDPDPFPGDTEMLHLDSPGVSLIFSRGKLERFNTYPPFKDSVDGICIGTHVADVEKLLGFPAREDYTSIRVGKTSCYRRWPYPDKGLVINFDRQDCALLIQKHR